MKKEHFDFLSKLYPKEFNDIRNSNVELFKQLKECKNDDEIWEIRRQIRFNVDEMLKLINTLK